MIGISQFLLLSGQILRARLVGRQVPYISRHGRSSSSSALSLVILLLCARLVSVHACSSSASSDKNMLDFILVHPCLSYRKPFRSHTELIISREVGNASGDACSQSSPHPRLFAADAFLGLP
ncbi:hypothetical protein B0J12DRAFT_387975 [Macrophomina phaseolina]|uniref:Secreted protein n=1 Tax=Macrophomina phaseolina TaxID=35725 RepID=A0ABQ8FU08_9PEZI|nr:hypothetical protein B0J12DRAFT_387975 [Macrophomina phaseolina]